MQARWALLTVMVLALAATAGAAGYKAPRTPAGQPDLQGIWSSNSLTRLERPAIYPSLVITEAQAREIKHPPVIAPDDVGQLESEWYDDGLAMARIGPEIRTSWIVDPADGRLPFTPEGRARLNRPVGADGPEARSTTERCLIAPANGPPMLNGIYNNNWQIVQTPDHLVISMEYGHETRIIRLGDRRRLPAALSPWMGDSIGWFEGESLVIETTNFAPDQSTRRYPLGQLYLSRDAVVSERLTRISRDQILYEYSVRDPANYTQVWRGQMPLNAAKGPIYEFACHEGNYSLSGILAGARRTEAGGGGP